jgi:hypothetical protein
MRLPGGALTAMLAGKPAKLPHPSTPMRELQKSARRTKQARKAGARRRHRTPRP